MILTSMYMANLTAHLTKERNSLAVDDLSDLLDQSEYKLVSEPILTGVSSR